MRTVRIWFRKIGTTRFISHLDLTRCMSRAIHRAKIPLWYTQGFNPRALLTFALPLSLGVAGGRESVGIKLEDDNLSNEELLERLNAAMPDDLPVFAVTDPVMKPGKIAYASFVMTVDPEGRDEILSEVKEYHKKTGTTVLLVSHSMEDIAKYADRVLVMSNKKIAMYDTVENVFARAPELLALGLSVPQVTKIFLKLREMGVDVPADVYTVPYAVKMILEAKKRRDAGESLVLPRVDAKKGGAATC